MINLYKLKCVRQVVLPHSSNEVVSLVILVMILGGATALILNYSFHQRENLSSEKISATILLPDKKSFAIGEEISSNVVLVNTANSNLILEKIGYNVVVFDINDASNVREIYASSQTHYLTSSLVIEPHSMYTIELGKIWPQKDMENHAVGTGDYLIKIEMNEYGVSLMYVISIR